MGLMAAASASILKKLKINAVSRNQMNGGDNQSGTYSYNVKKNSVWVIIALATGADANKNASTSISTPNCTTIFDVNTNVTANGGYHNRPLKIRCFIANKDTTVSHSASCGAGYAARYYGMYQIL